MGTMSLSLREFILDTMPLSLSVFTFHRNSLWVPRHLVSEKFILGTMPLVRLSLHFTEIFTLGSTQLSFSQFLHFRDIFTLGTMLLSLSLEDSEVLTWQIA